MGDKVDPPEQPLAHSGTPDGGTLASVSGPYIHSASNSSWTPHNLSRNDSNATSVADAHRRSTSAGDLLPTSSIPTPVLDEPTTPFEPVEQGDPSLDRDRTLSKQGLSHVHATQMLMEDVNVRTRSSFSIGAVSRALVGHDGLPSILAALSTTRSSGHHLSVSSRTVGDPSPARSDGSSTTVPSSPTSPAVTELSTSVSSSGASTMGGSSIKSSPQSNPPSAKGISCNEHPLPVSPQEVATLRDIEPKGFATIWNNPVKRLYLIMYLLWRGKPLLNLFFFRIDTIDFRVNYLSLTPSGRKTHAHRIFQTYLHRRAPLAIPFLSENVEVEGVSITQCLASVRHTLDPAAGGARETSPRPTSAQGPVQAMGHGSGTASQQPRDCGCPPASHGPPLSAGTFDDLGFVAIKILRAVYYGSADEVGSVLLGDIPGLKRGRSSNSHRSTDGSDREGGSADAVLPVLDGDSATPGKKNAWGGNGDTGVRFEDTAFWQAMENDCRGSKFLTTIQSDRAVDRLLDMPSEYYTSDIRDHLFVHLETLGVERARLVASRANRSSSLAPGKPTSPANNSGTKGSAIHEAASMFSLSTAGSGPGSSQRKRTLSGMTAAETAAVYSGSEVVLNSAGSSSGMSKIGRSSTVRGRRASASTGEVMGSDHVVGEDSTRNGKSTQSHTLDSALGEQSSGFTTASLGQIEQGTSGSPPHGGPDTFGNPSIAVSTPSLSPPQASQTSRKPVNPHLANNPGYVPTASASEASQHTFVRDTEDVDRFCESCYQGLKKTGMGPDGRLGSSNGSAASLASGRSKPEDGVTPYRCETCGYVCHRFCRQYVGVACKRTTLPTKDENTETVQSERIGKIQQKVEAIQRELDIEMKIRDGVERMLKARGGGYPLTNGGHKRKKSAEMEELEGQLRNSDKKLQVLKQEMQKYKLMLAAIQTAAQESKQMEAQAAESGHGIQSGPVFGSDHSMSRTSRVTGMSQTIAEEPEREIAESPGAGSDVATNLDLESSEVLKIVYIENGESSTKSMFLGQNMTAAMIVEMAIEKLVLPGPPENYVLVCKGEKEDIEFKPDEKPLTMNVDLKSSALQLKKRKKHSKQDSQSGPLLSAKLDAELKKNQQLSPEELKQHRKQREVLAEILETESNYVENLKLIVSIFVVPLTDSGALSEETLKGIFSNVEQILHFHDSILKCLQDVKTEDGVPPINVLIRLYETKVQEFDVYVPYCSNQSSAKRVLASVTSSDLVARKLLEDCQTNPKLGKYKLEDLLIMPMHRLTRLPLLLKRLAGTCSRRPESLHVSTALNQLIKSLETKISEVNEQVRRKESDYRINDLNESLEFNGVFEPFNLANGRRELLGEKNFLYIRRASHPVEVTLLVFTDMMLLTRIKRDQLVLFKQPIPLESTVFLDRPDTDDVKNAFQIIHMQQEIHLLQAMTAYDKNSWLQQTEVARSAFCSVFYALDMRPREPRCCDRERGRSVRSEDGSEVVGVQRKHPSATSPGSIKSDSLAEYAAGFAGEEGGSVHESGSLRARTQSWRRKPNIFLFNSGSPSGEVSTTLVAAPDSDASDTRVVMDRRRRVATATAAIPDSDASSEAELKKAALKRTSSMGSGLRSFFGDGGNELPSLENHPTSPSEIDSPDRKSWIGSVTRLPKGKEGASSIANSVASDRSTRPSTAEAAIPKPSSTGASWVKLKQRSIFGSFDALSAKGRRTDKPKDGSRLPAEGNRTESGPLTDGGAPMSVDTKRIVAKQTSGADIDRLLADETTTQARLLARHLASQKIDIVYSSDLRRALETARAVVEQQKGVCDLRVDVRMREKDFGEREGESFRSRQSAGEEGPPVKRQRIDSGGGDTKEQEVTNTSGSEQLKEETAAEIRKRCRAVLETVLGLARDSSVTMENLADGGNEAVTENTTPSEPVSLVPPAAIAIPRHIALVTHGIFISYLLRELATYSLNAPSITNLLIPPDRLGGGAITANTGVWTLQLAFPVASAPHPDAPGDVAYKVEVLERNGTEHLKGLKRAKGVGSAEVDKKQKSLESFFGKKKPLPALGESG
ncbi:hypothetical protein HDU93_006943 [Gonapodya sp. JEL0774]|nr:hypothetical protein HDU93_006943 [Gonapodya sp. JEL0774]